MDIEICVSGGAFSIEEIIAVVIYGYNVGYRDQFGSTRFQIVEALLMAGV